MKNEGNSDKINYLVRPTKQVERKLIIEALQCLGKNYDIAKYTYIGMGSRYFVDFQMVHKFLGINDMISFEKEEDKIKRFEFNKPYNFIDLQPGFSTDILSNLSWSKDFIVWLDYDNRISSYMMTSRLYVTMPNLALFCCLQSMQNQKGLMMASLKMKYKGWISVLKILKRRFILIIHQI